MTPDWQMLPAGMLVGWNVTEVNDAQSVGQYMTLLLGNDQGRISQALRHLRETLQAKTVLTQDQVDSIKLSFLYTLPGNTSLNTYDPAKDPTYCESEGIIGNVQRCLASTLTFNAAQTSHFG